jgi:hypothetical protein
MNAKFDLGMERFIGILVARLAKWGVSKKNLTAKKVY